MSLKRAHSIKKILLSAISRFIRNRLTIKGHMYHNYRGKLLNVIIWRTQGSKTDLLRELREGRVSEEWRVAQQLVAHVRLRRVQRPRVVADVLRAVEHAERESSEEVARRQ